MADVQMSLEDAIANGAAAQKRAMENADPMWKADAMDCIKSVAQRMNRFTADDIWELGNLPRTIENRRLGPLLNQAKKRGWCVPTNDYERSRQPQCHGMPRRIWQSLIYTEGAKR